MTEKIGNQVLKDRIKLMYDSQSNFADANSICRSTVSKVINGKEAPGIKTMMNWAKLLDMPVEELFGPLKIMARKEKVSLRKKRDVERIDGILRNRILNQIEKRIDERINLAKRI
jgi:transcriptional regulator with XRE-family HTH domain